MAGSMIAPSFKSTPSNYRRCRSRASGHALCFQQRQSLSAVYHCFSISLPSICIYYRVSHPSPPPPPAINTTVHVLVNEGTRRWCRLITGAGRICCSFPPILLLLFFHIRFVWMFCLNVQSSTKGKTWGKTKYLFILNVGKRKQLWQWRQPLSGSQTAPTPPK